MSKQEMLEPIRDTPIAASPSNPMELLAMAVQHGATADQLAKLMDVQERWDKNQAAKEFADALTEFQKRCPPVNKSRKANAFGGGGGYSYASLDDIMREIAPHLATTGLCVSFDVDHADGAANVIHIAVILRKGIHEQRTRFSCPVPSEMKVNATQKYGAALSYAKRYALCAALNITVTDEDTDGAGMGVKSETITEDQAITLRDMIESSGTDITKFLAWCKVGRLEDMPKTFYANAFDMLKKKLGGK